MHEFWILLISLSPIVELRGAIPTAMYLFGFPWWKAFLISVIGNILPVVPLLYLLEFSIKLFKKTKSIRRIFEKIEVKTLKKGKIVEKYEFIGLTIFVAIPFVGTGAWTGSLIASLLGLEKKKAFLAITIGILIAAVIVTALSLLGGWGILIGGVLITTVSLVLNKIL